MAANTGRTTSKWVQFNVDDSAGTLRSIPVNSINGVGLTYDGVDVTAFQDAIRGTLPGTPTNTIEISGPLDTSAAATAGTLSGSHTVLYNLAGGVTPLSLDVKIGIRQAWDAEPQFGLTSSTTVGYLCQSYVVNPNDATYTAVFVIYPGSSAPAWGTAAET